MLSRITNLFHFRTSSDGGGGGGGDDGGGTEDGYESDWEREISAEGSVFYVAPFSDHELRLQREQGRDSIQSQKVSQKLSPKVSQKKPSKITVKKFKK